MIALLNEYAHRVPNRTFGHRIPKPDICPGFKPAGRHYQTHPLHLPCQIRHSLENHRLFVEKTSPGGILNVMQHSWQMKGAYATEP
jgi:hypothetical protein